MERLAIVLVLVAAVWSVGHSSAEADLLTLTPPDTLIIDGENVQTGIFTLVGLIGLEPDDPFAGGPPCIPGNPPEFGGCGTSFFDLETVLPTIDPAVIGSGNENVLFTYPGAAPTGTIMTFSFEVTDPVLSGPGPIPVVGGATISAMPDFTISLPDTLSEPLFTEVIDFEGNVTYFIGVTGVAAFGGGLTTSPNPAFSFNIDLFGDGSWYFIAPEMARPDFQPQPHGSVRSRVPEPATCVLLGLGLLGLAGAQRVSRRE